MALNFQESQTLGLRNGLLRLLAERKMKPKLVDDDGIENSLKDWQLGVRNHSGEPECMAASPFMPFEGSAMTGFIPVEPKGDESMRSLTRSSPEWFESTTTTPRTVRTRTRIRSILPTSLESSNHGDLSPEKLGFPDGHGHNLLNVDEDSGIASPELIFGEISSKDAEANNFRARGSSQRISFTDESEVSQSPSPQRICNGSLLRDRKAHAFKDRTTSAWKPMKPVKPSTHGVGLREGTTNADKPRGSPLPLPAIETLHRSYGVSASGDRVSEFRQSTSVQARRLLDSISEGSKYDSSLSSIPGSPASSGREGTSTSNLVSPSVLLRCNARRQHDDKEADEDNDDDDDDDKVGMLCDGGFSGSNISGDFVRLLSKLCPLSVPLPKQSASQERGREVVRSNSVSPQVFSLETQNSSMACEDYVIVGHQNSLKLLSERCSSGSTPSYNVHKPRKIRDHEPHRHVYKTISKALDQKLRS